MTFSEFCKKHGLDQTRMESHGGMWARVAIEEMQVALDSAVAEERERCAQIVENLVRATDGVDALAAIRGEENLTPRRSWLRRNG